MSFITKYISSWSGKWGINTVTLPYLPLGAVTHNAITVTHNAEIVTHDPSL